MDETQLAWALADIANPYLSTAERHDIHIAIGIGETLAAICCLTGALDRHDLALPAALIDCFTRWLDTYAGSQEEAHLRELIARINRRPQPI
jgi:hypothetical protein